MFECSSLVCARAVILDGVKLLSDLQLSFRSLTLRFQRGLNVTGGRRQTAYMLMGGCTALYLHRTVAQHASLLSDGPAVPLRSVSHLHVLLYVLHHLSWLLSILCLLQGEHRKCANESKSTLLFLGLGCDQSHMTSHLIIYSLIIYF